MRVPFPLRSRPGAAALILLGALGACGRSGGRDPDVVLVIDGLEVRRQDWDALLPFAQAREPRRGVRSLRQFLLTDVVLRQALAQRWHGEQLARVRKEAQVLADLGKREGAPALLRYGAKEEGPLQAHEMAFPVAATALTLAEGQVADAILLPQGAVVVGVLDHNQGSSSELDSVRIAVRLFIAEPDPKLTERLQTAIKGLRGKISWLDRDWRDSVPDFLLSNQ